LIFSFVYCLMFADLKCCIYLKTPACFVARYSEVM